MEIIRRYIRATGWLVKLLLLKLDLFHVCDPAQVWTCVIMEQNHILRKELLSLFLMNLRRLWSVSQYTSEVVAPLCSRNSTKSGSSTLKKTVRNTLPADAPGKRSLVIVSELLRNPSAHFLITQSVANNYPNLDIHLCRQHSQCDTTITSH